MKPGKIAFSSGSFMIEKPYSVIVMSPLSAIGCGKQLTPSNAVTSAAAATNGTCWEVVFLIKPLGLLLSGQTQTPLPLHFGYRGLLVYITELRLVGIGKFLVIRVIRGSFCSSMRGDV